MTTLTENISLDIPWGIGEAKYGKIFCALSSRKIERIVEFGSGVSTVRLGKDFPDAEIISVEHSKQFHKQTVELLEAHSVLNARVLYCPLTRCCVGIRSYLSYDLDINQLEDGIDFVLIDGPPESQTLRGREAPLYMIFPLIKIGSLIALDDYHRDSAKAVVQNWLGSYKDKLRIVEEYEDIVLLEKTGRQDRPAYFGIHCLMDNCYVNIRLGIRYVKKFIKSTIMVNNK